MDVNAGNLRVKLKQWEFQFFKENSCKPTKNDIAKAPGEIQDAYRTFWKLTKANKNCVSSEEKTKHHTDVQATAEKRPILPPDLNAWGCDLNKSVAVKKPKKVSGSVLSKIGQRLKRNVENAEQQRAADLVDPSWALTETADAGKRRHEMRCVLQQTNAMDDDESLDHDLDFHVRISTSLAGHHLSRSISLNPNVGKNPAIACRSFPVLTKRDSSTAFDAGISAEPNRGCFPADYTNHTNDRTESPHFLPNISKSSVGLHVSSSFSMTPPNELMPSNVLHRATVQSNSQQLKPLFPSNLEPSSSLPSCSSDSIASEHVFKTTLEISDLSSKNLNSRLSCGLGESQNLPKESMDPSDDVFKFCSDEDTSGRRGVLANSNGASKFRKKKADIDLGIKDHWSADVMEDGSGDAKSKSRKKPGGKKSFKKFTTTKREIANNVHQNSDDDEDCDEKLPAITSKKRKRAGKVVGRASAEPRKRAKTASRSAASLSGSSKRAAPTENYVRINLKKKVFCRGKKKFNYRRYKYDRWKELQEAKRSGGPSDRWGGDEEACRLNEGDEEELQHILDSKPGSFVEAGEAVLTATPKDSVEQELPVYAIAEPLFEPTADGTIPKSVLKSAHRSLRRFGYDNFRPRQLESIARVLSGRSTLVLQPTGAGKSLCYLLAAHLYSQRSSCITVVISPLVSLMDDQVSRVPSFLRAESLHTNMTQLQREKVKEAVRCGEVDILFLSPEAVVGGAGSPFGCLPPEMPPIAFVCIDEVHCISSWSHNFRPSYLRLCWVVHEKLKVRCVLGLTATITQAALTNVSQHLRLAEDPDAIVRAPPLPSNLFLTVSRDNDEQAMLHLLRTKPFVDCHSIIIYCIRREQTERLATLIRTCLQQRGEDEWTAEAYHAGLTAARRRTIQRKFMAGELRVVTATVAFGMGLNKPDVRGVIHHSMPKSVESYVQEIGRAGRDGLPSFCHLFLDVQGQDRRELRRHIYSDSVDRSALAKLLKMVFAKCRCGKLREMASAISQDKNADEGSKEGDSGWKCPGHEVGFSVSEAIQELDIKEEGIDTLLAQLEMHPRHCLEVLNRTYGTCSLICYGGPEQLRKLATTCPAVAYTLAMVRQRKRKYDLESDNRIEFPLVEVAAALGTDSSHLRSSLRKLVWTEEIVQGCSRYKKSGIMVEFKDLYFHVRAVGDLQNEEIDEMLVYLHDCVCRHEATQIEHLETFYSTLHSVSFAHQWSCEGELSIARSNRLKEIVSRYFDGSEKLQAAPKPEDSDDLKISAGKAAASDSARSDIRNLLSVHHDHAFTGRAVARIFHGIGSPLYPAEVWGRTRQFWRSHLDYDFNELCKMATEEIIRFKVQHPEPLRLCGCVSPSSQRDSSTVKTHDY